MDILIIPEVAYLILVCGLLIAILALFAPGTGLIELAALSMLLLAGYSIYHLSFNIWALLLLLVGVFPFILAVRQSGRMIYLVISLAALVVGSAYLFPSQAWWQPGVNPLLALVVSILAGGFLWLVARKGLEALTGRPLINMDKVIGANGEAKTAIYNEGSVYVAGENWSAHSQVPIPAGTRIKVIAREGIIVEVEPLNKAT
jgi:membrane-bound serine protease (ClpP class)